MLSQSFEAKKLVIRTSRFPDDGKSHVVGFALRCHPWKTRLMWMPGEGAVPALAALRATAIVEYVPSPPPTVIVGLTDPALA